MLKPREEGNINPFCTLSTAQLKGQVVKINGDGTIAVAASGQGDGLLAQNTIDFSTAYRTGYRDLSTTDANVGDVVGWYWNGGTYETNMFVGTVTAGNKLYANASGYLEYFAAPAAGDVAIAKAVTTGTSNGAGENNTTFVIVDLLV